MLRNVLNTMVTTIWLSFNQISILKNSYNTGKSVSVDIINCAVIIVHGGVVCGP